MRAPSDPAFGARGSGFVHGGVHFELRAATTDPGLRLPLCSRPAEPDEPLLVGRVLCDVEIGTGPREGFEDLEPEPDARRLIRWKRLPDGWNVTTTGVRARVWQTDEATADRPAGYRATAWLAGEHELGASLVSALSSLVVSECGGLSLHAASIELRGGVVAFIGPSGAGKSTACHLCAPAPQFSVDRLAVVPGRRGGWVAHALPGGTPIGLPAARALSLPLSAILRVRRGDAERQVRGRSESEERASRVGLIRESCFHGSRDKLSQLALLSAVDELCRQVVVGEIGTTLGVSALPEVERRIRAR